MKAKVWKNVGYNGSKLVIKADVNVEGVLGPRMQLKDVKRKDVEDLLEKLKHDILAHFYS